MSRSYGQLTYKDLRKEASLKSIEGRSKMSKVDIIDALNDYDSLQLNFSVEKDYPVNKGRIEKYMRKNNLDILNFNFDFPFLQPIDPKFGLTKDWRLNKEFQKFLLSREFVDTVNYAMKSSTVDSVIKMIMKDLDIKPHITFKLAAIDPNLVRDEAENLRKDAKGTLCGQKKGKMVKYYEILMKKKLSNPKLNIGSFTEKVGKKGKYETEEINPYWAKANCENGKLLIRENKKHCKKSGNRDFLLLKLIAKSHVSLYILDCQRKAIYSMDSQLVTNNSGMDFSLKETVNFFLDEEIELLDVFHLCNCPKIRFQEKTLFCQTWTMYLTLIFLLNPDLIKEGPGRIFNFFDELDITRHFLIVQFLFYIYKHREVKHNPFLAAQQKIHEVSDAEIISNISYLFVKYSRNN